MTGRKLRRSLCCTKKRNQQRSSHVPCEGTKNCANASAAHRRGWQLCVNVVSGEAVQRSGETAELLEPVWFCYSGAVSEKQTTVPPPRADDAVHLVLASFALYSTALYLLYLHFAAATYWCRVGMCMVCTRDVHKHGTDPIVRMHPTPETPATDGRPVVQ